MFIGDRSGVASVSAATGAARLPWLASTPSAASELVCVGKIKSNGVSQSLFIDRSEWPPKTSQHNVGVGQQARPHQTRAAAVVAAAAVAAAAPKVICISPAVANHQRSHTVIRRATTTTHHQYHCQQQENTDVMHGQQMTGGSEVPVNEVGRTQQRTVDAAASVPVRPSSKRTFEETKDYDSRHLHLQLTAVANAKAKAARIAVTDAIVTSSTTSTVLPGSSVLLPWWTSKSGAHRRHHLRPLLPRGADMQPACTMTNVVSIIPTASPEPTASTQSVASCVVVSRNESPSSAAISSVAACTQTASVACRPIPSTTATTSATECFERAASQSVHIECRWAKERNDHSVGGSQLMQRIRLIECEMTSAANASPTAPPFCINVVPRQASADDRPSTQRPATLDCTADASGDDTDNEQPPAQMLQALRLVRNPSTRPRRDVTVTSSVTASNAATASTSQHPRPQVLAPATAPASSAVTRLVTMKLVNRSTSTAKQAA